MLKPLASIEIRIDNYLKGSIYLFSLMHHEVHIFLHETSLGTASINALWEICLSIKRKMNWLMRFKKKGSVWNRTWEIAGSSTTKSIWFIWSWVKTIRTGVHGPDRTWTALSSHSVWPETIPMNWKLCLLVILGPLRKFFFSKWILYRIKGLIISQSYFLPTSELLIKQIGFLQKKKWFGIKFSVNIIL